MFQCTQENRYRYRLSELSVKNSINFTLFTENMRKEEVVQAIKQLNASKSPGPDGLPTLAIKYRRIRYTFIIDLLTCLYNEGLNCGCVGESFYHGVMCVRPREMMTQILITTDI